jgi:1-acyl-sn-glycerol-3-phosphate acyltransferase
MIGGAHTGVRSFARQRARSTGEGLVEATYGLARTILKPWLSTWFKWSIEGVENIPRSGPALLAVNHIAFLDPLATAYVVDKAHRIPRFLAKSELFRDKKIGWVLRGAKQIEVRRGSKDAPMALEHAFAALEKGELIVVFPEGTITTDPDLKPMRAKTGLARLALGSGVPVIPMALWGTANIWPKGYAKRWRPRQDILCRVGEPVAPFSGDPDTPSDWEAVGDEVMDRIAVLLASLRHAVPDRRHQKKSAA